MFKRDVISEALKGATKAIPFEEVSRYLPFQTRIVSGETYNHIQSRHRFDIETVGKMGLNFRPTYVVSENETLCRRGSRITFERGGVMDENCPGCLAIAQGIINRDIRNANQ